MTNVGDVFDWLDQKTYTSEDTVASDLWQFFSKLPLDVDLASASYYLEKEFKRNDTGVDDRVRVFTFDPEPEDDEGYWDSSGYDEWDDEEDEF